jgi:hypothetical protein
MSFAAPRGAVLFAQGSKSRTADGPEQNHFFRLAGVQADYDFSSCASVVRPRTASAN